MSCSTRSSQIIEEEMSDSSKSSSLDPDGGGGLRGRLSDALFSVTIEPAILMFITHKFLITGSQVRTDLILFKICADELGYNDTFCEDTESDAYADVEDDIQSRANEYFLVETWLWHAPAVVWALFMGALSDEVFGRKPLMLIPLVGFLISALTDLVLSIFYRDLPLEAFYLTSVGYLLGGEPVYYMGHYGYGASISSETSRTSTLARFDGVEQVGQLVATLLSDPINSWLGNQGSFAFSAAFVLGTILYLVFVAKEPRRKKTESSPSFPGAGRRERLCRFLKEKVVVPTSQMLDCLLRPRPGWMRTFILVQVACLGLYWFMIEQINLLYLWLLNVFDDFDGQDYANYTVYYKCLGIIGLLVVMPLLTRRLGIHEAVVLVGINVANAASYVATAFSVEVWQFYLAQAAAAMWYSEFSAARALMSKCVGERDVGKIYSAVGIIGALLPMASNPAYRELYDATLDSFPGAFLLFSASLCILVGLAMVPIAIYRKRMESWKQEQERLYGEEEDDAKKDRKSPSEKRPPPPDYRRTTSLEIATVAAITDSGGVVGLPDPLVGLKGICK